MEQYFERIQELIDEGDVPQLEKIWKESFLQGEMGLAIRAFIDFQLDAVAEIQEIDTPKTFPQLAKLYHKK